MSETSSLPEKLQAHLPANLEANRDNFSEFSTKVNPNKLAEIRDRLLKLDLLHQTYADPSLIQEMGLQPISRLPEGSSSNTFRLDRDLGLDEAVFFGWGNYMDRSRGLWVCAEAELLLDERTIVTPCDINALVFSQDSTFVELSQDRQEKVRAGYFDMMLSGSDWLEMIARRIVLQDASRIALKGFALGEVKVFRPIEPEMLTIVSEPLDKEVLVSDMNRLGFIT